MEIIAIYTEEYSAPRHFRASIHLHGFFMGSVSGYYTSSPETVVEADLADLRNVKTEVEFAALLENKIAAVFTNDYFNVSLPSNLATSASRSPVWFGYCAAFNILGAKVLFSKLPVSELFRPATDGTESALERHHLFPKAYLDKIGISDEENILALILT